MDEYAQLRALMDLVEMLGVSIRNCPALAQRAGALVKIHGAEVLFINPSASVADRLAVVADALKGRGELEEMYIVPELRRLIELA